MIAFKPWMRVGEFELVRAMRRVYPGSPACWMVQCLRCGDRLPLPMRLLASRMHSGEPLVCESGVCRGSRVYTKAFAERLAKLRSMRVRLPSSTRTTEQHYGGDYARQNAIMERLEWDLQCIFSNRFPEPDDDAACELLSRGPNPSRQW